VKHLSEPVTQPMIARTFEHRWQDAPPEVSKLIKDCVLDLVGVAIVGACEPAAEALRGHVSELGGAEQSSVFGSSHRVSMESAALLNGAIAHMLDYDDVNFAILGHPSAPVLPAVLAIGEFRRVSGAELMNAFLTGYETACRVRAGTLQSRIPRNGNHR